MTEKEQDAVIIGAEIGAGHDGNAELFLRLRYENGVEGSVTLDRAVGFALMRACGVEDIAQLAGHSWRKILEGL